MAAEVEAANGQPIAAPPGLADQAKKGLFALSKSGFNWYDWMLGGSVIAIVTYFWTRILADIFEGRDA